MIGLVLLQIFRLPLPGPPVVTGSYGELRGTVVHLGIDFGVGEKIGQVPALSTGNGYVYRIRVSHTGYGKVVYIQHPNGLRTVYGHLSHFAPKGEEVVLAEQVRQGRFEVEVFLRPEQWPVKAGDTIGWVGNSGYSFGPHLHFEVRTRQDETLPPYAYLGLTDSIPPVFIRVGLVPLTEKSAVAGQGGYRFLRLSQTTCSQTHRLYRVRDTLSIIGAVGVVYTVGDRMGWSRAWTGVAEVVLRTEKGDTLYRVQWDTLSYDWRRFIPWHVDEPYNQIYRVGVERLYKVGPVLPWTRGEGVIQLRAGEVRGYEVVARDFSGNVAVVPFVLRGEAERETIARLPLDPASVWSIEGGLLLARKSYEVVFADGSREYVSPTRPVRLRGRHPVRLIAARDTQETQVVAVLYPGHAAEVLLGRGCRLVVFPESLLDTVYVRAFWEETPWGNVLHLGNAGVPLRAPALLLWDLSSDFPLAHLRRSVPIYRGRQGGWDAVSGYRWQGFILRIPVRRWGRYAVIVDTLSPGLRPLRPQGPFYLVEITDFGSGVDPYSLRVEVVAQEAAASSRLFPEYYVPQHRLYLPRRAGRTFRVTVRDKVGNERVELIRF